MASYNGKISTFLELKKSQGKGKFSQGLFKIIYIKLYMPL